MTSTERLQQIAAMYAAQHEQLQRVVARRGSSDEDNVQDACAYAWAELVSAEHVDLGPPRWGALAWLTTVAVRRAWELGRHQARSISVGDLDALGQLAAATGHSSPAVDELVAQKLRLDLVKQIPERPRRFLLRLAVGYSYHEIAAAENATLTTTGHQLARARRLLRELQARQHAAEGGEHHPPRT